MSNFCGSNVFSIFEEQLNEKISRNNTLFIALGLLGDFDSLEYIQFIIPFLNDLEYSNVNLIVVGIGNEESKKQFCGYTKLPEQYLRVVENSLIHKKLNLDSGLDLNLHPIINLMLMCFGVNSAGTLAEVLRGYLGDRHAKKIFHKNEYIKLLLNIKISSNLFNLLYDDGSLRPFELASLRLMNMIEVLSNWDTYMIDNLYLTQRSATFLLDDGQKILYSYLSNSLLGYSETMHKPLQFLENWIKI